MHMFKERRSTVDTSRYAEANSDGIPPTLYAVQLPWQPKKDLTAGTKHSADDTPHTVPETPPMKDAPSLMNQSPYYENVSLYPPSYFDCIDDSATAFISTGTLAGEDLASTSSSDCSVMFCWLSASGCCCCCWVCD